jgi:glycosyltransferase involved in cell wall biosynthesis
MISVCMAVHNEEVNLPAAIASVAGWAGEIIVVDCESSDRSSEVARNLGAVVYARPNRVPEANKNESFPLAQGEWIFILDADELVPEPLKQEIEATIARNPQENGFKIPRRNYYFGAPLSYGGAWPDRQLRLFRRGTGIYPGTGHHERMKIDGEVGELSSQFDHHPYPDFDIWLRKFVYYTDYGASLHAKQRTPITPRTIRRNMITRPLRRWFERLFIKRGIRDGVPGVLAATFDLMTHVVSFGKYWKNSN